MVIPLLPFAGGYSYSVDLQEIRTQQPDSVSPESLDNIYPTAVSLDNYTESQEKKPFASVADIHEIP